MAGAASLWVGRYLAFGAHACSNVDFPRHVSYLTDVEGNMTYFDNFVSVSKAVSYSDEGRLVLEDDFSFVFGGDLFDKGPGDRRLSELLCDLKDRYPDRVFLLMGNRDINKLRFPAELRDTRVYDRPPFWDPGAPSLSDFSETRGGAGVGVSLRARWMYECTLGCPHTFMFRKTELSHDIGREATDDEVANFLIASALPGGYVFEYLRRATVGVGTCNPLPSPLPVG